MLITGLANLLASKIKLSLQVDLIISPSHLKGEKKPIGSFLHNTQNKSL